MMNKQNGKLKKKALFLLSFVIFTEAHFNIVLPYVYAR